MLTFHLWLNTYEVYLHLVHLYSILLRFSAEASSRATRLDVLPVEDTQEDGTLVHSLLACLKIWYKTLYFVSYFMTYGS